MREAEPPQRLAHHHAAAKREEHIIAAAAAMVVGDMDAAASMVWRREVMGRAVRDRRMKGRTLAGILEGLVGGLIATRICGGAKKGMALEAAAAAAAGLEGATCVSPIKTEIRCCIFKRTSRGFGGGACRCL